MKTNIKDTSIEEYIQDASEFIPGRIHHQSLIVLYGLGNQGKTSTLTDLLFLLTNARIRDYVNAYFVRTMSNGSICYNDGYYVLKYERRSVFIATYGDGREECERNKDFFEHRPIDVPIYVIEKDRVLVLDELSEKEQKKKYKDVTPDFCISACRTEGGSVDAMMYLSDKMLPHILQEVWIRKLGIAEGEKPDFIYPSVPIITRKDDNVARAIKAFIRRVKDHQHCI